MRTQTLSFDSFSFSLQVPQATHNFMPNFERRTKTWRRPALAGRRLNELANKNGINLAENLPREDCPQEREGKRIKT